ncbi:MAG: hypothetical protein N2255_07835 [Kiritimatiellae bacterium]|nr:hypothetical protein [Kiritimatiellia bacterium]
MSDRAKTIFRTYFEHLFAMAARGDAREESFYPALAAMLKAVAQATGRSHIEVTTLPKKTDAGNPDFRLWNGTDRIVGYIEAKHPAEQRLDARRGKPPTSTLPGHVPELDPDQLFRVSALPERPAAPDRAGWPALCIDPAAHAAAG